MITRRGAAFGSADDGDMNDEGRRVGLALRLGVSAEWATVTQVHGSTIRAVDSPGAAGEGDGLVTTTPRLPLMVRTADCAGVVLHGPGTVGVAHVGWRGAAAGVLERTAEMMEERGARPLDAIVGPRIGPCCFEVGPEVLAVFPGAVAATTWGTPSIDLVEVIRQRLPGTEVVAVGGCTRCSTRWFSHRRDRTVRRQGAIGWIP